VRERERDAFVTCGFFLFYFQGEVKCLMQQLLRAVAHLHDNWILHRDLKTSNLLLSHKGILKVGDFGLAREYGSPLKAYTPIVVTLWYRAPELLLCTKVSTATFHAVQNIVMF
jgi:cell division cycle 2-like protein